MLKLELLPYTLIPICEAMGTVYYTFEGDYRGILKIIDRRWIN